MAHVEIDYNVGKIAPADMAALIEVFASYGYEARTSDRSTAQKAETWYLVLRWLGENADFLLLSTGVKEMSAGIRGLFERRKGSPPAGIKLYGPDGTLKIVRVPRATAKKKHSKKRRRDG